MSHRTSRRGFLTAAVATAGGAVALPAVLTSSASAGTPTTAAVVHADHPNATYAGNAQAEPLNASAPCGEKGRNS